MKQENSTGNYADTILVPSSNLYVLVHVRSSSKVYLMVELYTWVVAINVYMPTLPLMQHSHSADYGSRLRSDSTTTRKVEKSDYYPQ